MTALPITMDIAARHADECVDLLQALVASESPTGDEEANRAIAEILERTLIQAGASVERCPAPDLGVHLVGRFRATASDGRRPLLLVGHMDTVHPVGTLEHLPFVAMEGKLYGPGIYDMKGGVAVALTALRILTEMNGGLGSDIVFLITCDEEWGSPHSRERIESESRAARAALVLEPSVSGGGVKSQRKGVSAYTLHVGGQAAHAGIEPEAGANAVHELARQICRICDLARVERGTTVSIGVVSGGTAENVVAAAARCTIDVRFWTAAEAWRIDTALRSMAPLNARCTLTLDGGINRGPLEKTPASSRLYRRAQAIARELGRELGEGKTGGGSDGNLTSAVGCPTLDGLGPDGAGAHTLSEHVLIGDIPFRIALITGLLGRL